MDPNVLAFGRTTPPTPAVPLKAGALTMVFEPETGFLRYFELPSGIEALRGIYPTCRRGDWSTVAPEIDDLKLEAGEDGFVLTFRLVYSDRFEGIGRIAGDAQGVSYTLEGKATKTFETSRTGLCVLHPLSQAELPLEIIHPDGKRESGRFPDSVQPDWPFRDIAGMSIKLPGYRMVLTFEGEVFEMEDQRNWADASFKTYCRPQHRPFPYELSEGEAIAQTVRVGVRKWGSPEPEEEIPDGVGMLFLAQEAAAVPLIGLVADESATSELTQYAPVDYVRLPVEAAGDIGIPVEITIDLSEDAEARIERAVETIRGLAEPPERIIVTPVSAAKYALPIATALEGAVPVLVGAKEFGEISRSKLKKGETDGICFGLHPQAHLIDDATLFDNGKVIVDLVDSAAEKTEGAIVVGPIRLGAHPDPRTGSMLFASWLVTTLANAFLSDAEALTLFDLAGPDGLFREDGPILAYQVLADINEFSEGDLIAGLGTARRVSGFGLALEDRFRTIVANETPEPLEVIVPAVSTQPHYLKILEEDAAYDAAGWRKKEGDPITLQEGLVNIKLGPYGVARIDTTLDELDADETLESA